MSDGIVNAQGRLYVGDIGYNFVDPAAQPVETCVIVLVSPDGRASIVADKLCFPNGMVITPDGKTLIVGETLGHRLTAFDIQEDCALSNRRIWAQLPSAVGPDGICLDAEGGNMVCQGKAPLGKGVWNHSGIILVIFPSQWYYGVFLLIRRTFEVEDLNFDSYRIAILARQGFHVYLNAQKILSYIWWADSLRHGSILLRNDQTKLLKKGKNVLAVYANDQYDLKSPEHFSAIDARIEGITKADQEKLDLALEEILSPKDSEALKGASNGGYHYFGSAKILTQMAKAFAEANLKLIK